ncbi:MAG: leucine-rich repeat domain-containing protein [archaeon YNP-WB-040]|nr:leucine-rich repeat domain-containing protein [Candidatus Culexarchaeum yellowstonense]
MKKYSRLLALLVIGQMGYTAQSDVIKFVDPNLEQAVRDALGIPKGRPITRADMKRLTSLDAEFEDIRNLSGLEYAINLQWLNLWGNEIKDISPLSNLSNLWLLWLSYNQISDISPLVYLTNLQKLDLEDNQISDISPLANLTDLQWLVLDHNQISDISPLANLTNLQKLDLYRNQISDISPLANLTNLWYLDLSNNQISDISPLVGNPGLGQGDEVDLENNPLDLTPGSDDMKNIQILQSRGVIVYY